jgi:transcriptional regulator GlxA family with amidase domain
MTLQYFHTNYDRKILLKELAQHLTVSHAHLCRVFCDRYKVSPMQYLNNWRIQEAKELLINTEMSITEISTRVGFQSVHYLSRRFTAKEKMSPLQYRQKMKEITELKIDEKFDIVDNMVVMHG